VDKAVGKLWLCPEEHAQFAIATMPCRAFLQAEAALARKLKRRP
jgi:hypothetical protein